MTVITFPNSKRNFKFRPVTKRRYEQCNKNVFPISSRKVDHVDHHPNNSKCKQMTPNQSQHLHRIIQSILPLMNCRNLHTFKLFSLTRYAIAQTFVKVIKNQATFLKFFKHSATYDHQMKHLKKPMLIFASIRSDL